MIRRDFPLGVLARALRVGPREVRVHAIDRGELPVAANVIVVGVGVENDDGELGEFGGDFLNVADAHAGVEEQGLLLTDDEVGDDFFGLVGFVNREDVRGGFVDFEPGVGDLHALEGFVFGAGERFAPVRWNWGLGRWTLRGEK